MSGGNPELAKDLWTLRDEFNIKLNTAYAQTFAFCNQDLLLAHTDAEDRIYVRITQELYDAGWTACVDEWMDVDGNGEADATDLVVGDVLIINTKPNGERSAYRIDRDMFEETHTY